MRRHGARSTLTGLASHDHGCLLYADDATYAAEVTSYVREGLALGERVIYVGSGPPPFDVDAFDGTGAVEVVEQPEAYDVDLDPVKQTAAWEAHVGDALAYGFTGLRTVGEVTPLLVDEESRRRQLHWEACADRMLADLPWTAMCCYDRRRLPPDALSDVAAVHPIDCGDNEPVFRLFSDGPATLAVAGELDSFDTEAFERLVALAAPDGPYTLDLSRVEFIAHDVVRKVARLREREITVRRAPPVAERVADVLGLELY